MDLNLTVNLDGMMYYQLYIGDSPTTAISAENIQIYIKNQISTIQSQKDFLS